MIERQIISLVHRFFKSCLADHVVIYHRLKVWTRKIVNVEIGVRRIFVVLLGLLLFQYAINVVIFNRRHVILSTMTSSSQAATFPTHPTNEDEVSDEERTKSSDSILSRLTEHLPRLVRKLLGVNRPEVKPRCPEVPSNLIGALPRVGSRRLISYDELVSLHGELSGGGRWSPPTCTARHRVAIIVPYRDRDKHLRMFLYHMHPFLQKQQIDYAIYVVEQAQSSPFNRGMLMNIGFTEAGQLYEYDCFIFHDVDLLPENDRNLYWCPESPRHMSVAVDTMFYRLPYPTIFGGVEALSKSHFQLINGFSNKFFGWGGEDDDLYNRLVFNHLNLTRYPIKIARYKMLSHEKDKPNPHRVELVSTGPERFELDGLSTLQYERKELELRPLYTWIFVNISDTKQHKINVTTTGRKRYGRLKT